MTIERIALVTDFASGGPYLGQMRLLLTAATPGVPVVELISDLVPYAPEFAAYFLPALVSGLPAKTLYLCVVDPGVGSERAVLAAQIGDDWFLAPDNGLLAPLVARHRGARLYRVGWRPVRLSASFHGRDLFLPLGVRLVRGESLEAQTMEAAAMIGWGWASDLPRVIYVDGFGNLITGLRAEGLHDGIAIRVGDRPLGRARTFCEVPPGTAFWYANAFGLVELAVNQGRADRVLGLGPGAPIQVLGGA